MRLPLLGSAMVMTALLLSPVVSYAKPPANPAPATQKKPKPGKKPTPPPATPTPPVAPEPAPPAPTQSELQSREDPNAKTPEQLAKEKEAAKKDSEPKDTSLGGLFGLNIPVGPYATVSGVGFGGYLDFEHHLSPVFALGARAGFAYHLDARAARTESGVPHSIDARAHVLPIYLSARIYPIPEGSAGAPYFVGEAGLTLRMVSQDDTNLSTNTTKSDSAFKPNLGLGLGVGYTIKGFDVRAMLNSYSLAETIGFAMHVRLALGIFVGYRFLRF